MLAYLDHVDPRYAAALRTNLLPLYDYLPEDLSGLAWQQPALQAYVSLPPARRHELTTRIGDMAARLQAMRIVYAERSTPDRAEIACRCAASARQMDAFAEAGAAAYDALVFIDRLSPWRTLIDA